jgi:hypothetical protein
MSTSRSVSHRLLAACLGIAMGALAAGGFWCGYRCLKPVSRKITASEHGRVRQKLDEDPGGIYAFDEQTSYRYKPSFHGYRPMGLSLPLERRQAKYDHVTNNIGLVGTDEIRQESDIARILLLGDSVTFGACVDFQSTFAAKLQQAAGKHCQVAIAACEGWSTKQEVAFYDKFLGDIEWRRVLLVICLNDLVNFEWVYDSSAGFKLAEELQEVGGLSLTNQSVAGMRLALLRSRFASSPETVPLSRQNNTTLWAWDDQRWHWYFETLLTPLAVRRDMRSLSLVVAPTRDQLDAIDLGAEADIAFYPQRKLQKFAAEHGLPYIDLAVPFAGLSQNELSRYFLDTLHFTEEGHALIASYLAERLRTDLNAGGERLTSRPGANTQ